MAWLFPAREGLRSGKVSGAGMGRLRRRAGSNPHFLWSERAEEHILGWGRKDGRHAKDRHCRTLCADPRRDRSAGPVKRSHHPTPEPDEEQSGAGSDADRNGPGTGAVRRGDRAGRSPADRAERPADTRSLPAGLASGQDRRASRHLGAQGGLRCPRGQACTGCYGSSSLGDGSGQPAGSDPAGRPELRRLSRSLSPKGKLT
jgi:hypothetical protein